MRRRTVFDDLRSLQHDEDFQPVSGPDFYSTGAEPGSDEKIDVMRARVSNGQPLWHPDDPVHEFVVQHEYATGIRVCADPSTGNRKSLLT
jgi:hypothetical protein